MKSKFALDRRTMLRGMLGGAAVAMALPPLEAMLNTHGDALADGGALPRRFMTWFFGDGARLDRWIPPSQGSGWELTEELAPLVDVKDYVSVLSGFDNKAGYGRRGHHDGIAGCFSGIPFIELDPMGANYASKSGGPTIDQVAAAALAGQTYLPSIQIGISKRVATSEGPTLYHLSHKSPDEPLPAIKNPQEIWDKLFGNFVPPDDPSGALRVGMLDAVKADAERLRKRVGKNDQQRLDAHLQAIKQLQDQIAAIPPACTVPGKPTETNDDTDGLEPLDAVCKAMTELVVIAWACDITRVVSWMQSGSVGHTLYDMVGAPDGIHNLTHEDTPTAQEFVHQAVTWNMSMFAHLLTRLRETPEGAGNLLDNSCILLGSDCSEGLTHSTFDQPILVAGGGGGDLVHPGIHYRSQSGENTTDILLTCLQTIVPTATEAGADQGYSNTPCSAIKV